jgi:hypothetical protein
VKQHFLAINVLLCFIVLILAGCGSDDSSTPTQSATLEPAAQAIAIQTSIQEQFTLTAEYQEMYAPTQTINAAVQQTAQVNNSQTAEYVAVITNDAYSAITATLFARTATQDAKNADPLNMQHTVDALVSQRFTATARAQLQIDINRTVDAAVELTSTAAAQDAAESVATATPTP